ncbi:hypothetical protein [Candidatus Phytoplasma luffae]|nr:hypothetical protein [Candidatus Phytoplasma luffae]
MFNTFLVVFVSIIIIFVLEKSSIDNNMIINSIKKLFKEKEILGKKMKY